MLKLATLIENPGEPPVQSRFRDPAALVQLGFNARMIYQSTAISGVAGPEAVAEGELRRWVSRAFDQIGRTIEESRAAGLGTYLCYDALVLAGDVVSSHAGALTCKNRPRTLCPASEGALEHSARALEAILRRWPGVDGVVLRLGDTDAPRLPHLLGNDIYAPRCPRCRGMGPAKRIIQTIHRFHALVTRKLGKRLIVRAWNVRPGGLHDSAELCERVAPALPGEGSDDRLMLMFKFTWTDFWRYQKWNPSSLVCGDRPIVYELQCQREFEGKGGLPNWQPPLWRDGYPETRGEGPVAGLAGASKAVNLAGLCAWARGGGWGGPFIRDESWIDANVFAVPRLADDPAADVDKLGRAWIRERLGVEDPAVEAVVMDVLGRSAQVVREAFYIGAFAAGRADPWHPSADWISDDLIDARAAWRMIQGLEESRLDEVVAEKQRAAETISDLRRRLQQAVGDRARPALEPLVSSLMYGESLVEAIRDLVAGLVAYRRYEKHRAPGFAQGARDRLFHAQAHWNHHTQRAGTFPGAASPFREAQFWELTQEMLATLTAP